MSRSGRGEGSALRCEQVRILLMGYLDGELEAAQLRAVEDHLAVCVACRGEERAYRKLGRLTEESLGEEVQVNTTEAWENVYTRIERRAGWVLLWIGILVLGGYGLWQLVSEFLLAADVPLVIRIGVGTLAAGGLTLLVSFFRETLSKYKTERYREVQR